MTDNHRLPAKAGRNEFSLPHFGVCHREKG